MKLATHATADNKWQTVDILTHRYYYLGVVEAAMSPTVGRGGGGRSASSVMCVLLQLAAVLLLTVGVSAIPEEHKPAQEQPPEEVQPSTY